MSMTIEDWERARALAVQRRGDRSTATAAGNRVEAGVARRPLQTHEDRHAALVAQATAAWAQTDREAAGLAPEDVAALLQRTADRWGSRPGSTSTTDRLAENVRVVATAAIGPKGSTAGQLLVERLTRDPQAAAE